MRRVMAPAVAYIVTDALREALSRGTGSAVVRAGFRAPAAGKTGTTNDGTDAWFVGYTPEHAGGGLDRLRRAAADHGARDGRPARGPGVGAHDAAAEAAVDRPRWTGRVRPR